MFLVAFVTADRVRSFAIVPLFGWENSTALVAGEVVFEVDLTTDVTTIVGGELVFVWPDFRTVITSEVVVVQRICADRPTIMRLVHVIDVIDLVIVITEEIIAFVTTLADGFAVGCAVCVVSIYMA